MQSAIQEFKKKFYNDTASVCFVFWQSLADYTFTSLCVNAAGAITAPLSSRNAYDLSALPCSSTVIVLPTAITSLHEVDIPWMSERKALRVVLYALEDMLTQPITEIHVAIKKQQDGKYLVVAIDKAYLSSIVSQFQLLNIKFNSITLDWFALHDSESVCSDYGLLVNSIDFKGLLAYDWEQPTPTPYKCNDIVNFTATSIDIDTPTPTWIATRLAAQKGFNLCQGDLKRSYDYNLRWYYASLSCLAGCVLLVMIIKFITGYMLNQRVQELDKSIATTYQQLFPNTPRPLDVRGRVNSWLKQHALQDYSVFWRLQNIIANNHQVEFTSLRFQAAHVILNLSCKNFADLENFKARIHQEGSQVKQLEAQSKSNNVVASLEISL